MWTEHTSGPELGANLPSNSSSLMWVRPTNKLEPNNRICATTDMKTGTSQDLRGQL